MKRTTVRTLVASLFIVGTISALVFANGWGTLSSFGYEQIAMICPLGSLETMFASKEFLPHTLIALGIFAVLAIVFGRFFCGWICPVPLLRKVFGIKDAKDDSAESCTGTKSAKCASCALKAADPKEAASASPNPTPYVVLGGTLASCAVFGFPVFCLICPVGLTFAVIIGAWRIFEFQEISWSVPLFLFFLVLELVVLRKWCHKFCPLGALFSAVAFLNRTFRPQIQKEACLNLHNGIPCQKCKIACPEGIDLRAANSPAVMARCTKCGKCAEACTVSAITFYGLKSKLKNIGQLIPALKREKYAPAERVNGFKEIYKPLTLKQALTESSRCISCGLCSEKCPQHNSIPAWISAVAEKDFVKAYNILFNPGNMPEICSRVCPQDKLCESACPLAETGGPIAIGMLSRFVADRALVGRWHPAKERVRGKPKTVAIIGAGPSGLSCADILARKGVKVTVYDARKEIGGLMTFAIPSFKLEKTVIKKRRSLLEKLGIKFELGKKIGKDVPFEDLVRDNDAVLVATGASAPKYPDFLKPDNDATFDAITFLNEVNKNLLKITPELPFSLKDKRVVVLGGGDTAMDCMRSSIRLGAAKVTGICRNKPGVLRANRGEIENALEEGAQIIYESQPLSLEKKPDGTLTLMIKNQEGKEAPVECDVLITAFGLAVEPLTDLSRFGVELDNYGRITVEGHGSYRTSHPKIYASGDAVNGADLVVTAVATGKAAAKEILASFSPTPTPKDEKQWKLQPEN